ncbi:MAG: hypothetical protein F4Y03_02295 [Alphaproteobacteria bacterium]|nr:hypothetical protein [Alphaproteobacteria bacterium]
MVALNFAASFAPAVESGRKRQTIREKRRCEVGQALQLYTGQRTRACRKLGEATCTGVSRVRLYLDEIVVDDNTLAGKAADAVAKADGFGSYDEMATWFLDTYGALPFNGWLIQWELSDG